MYDDVCVCARVGERERECVCVCVREREREGEPLFFPQAYTFIQGWLETKA